MFILFMPLVSSWDWDNLKTYDEETKTIEIYNSWIIPNLIKGELLAEAKLITPQVYNVIDRGAVKQLVAEIQINNLDERNNDFFGGLDLFDIKKGMESFDRDYEINYKKFHQIEVNDYETICKEREVINTNGTYIEKYDCLEK